jgi:hypothetical protein
MASRCVLGLSLVSLAQAAALVPPNAEEVQKIEHAVPTRAAAVPARAHRILVFTRCRGYVHASIPFGAKALELMGRKTGAFQAVVSDDIAWFEPEKLQGLDGICLMSALGEFFLPDDFDRLPAEAQAAARQKDARLKEGFYAWLRSGKALSAIHGGCYSFHDTPAFAELFGGAFDSHPWNAYEKIAIRLDDPGHPVLAAFGGCGLELVDEGYQFKAPYSRATLRVLYSLDLSRMDTNKPNLRADHDLGLCWVKRYGQGRIFYSALGHNNEEFWNPTLLRHFLDGIQFSLGDLPGETTPLPPAAR